ncbi:hypothetical protein AWB75_01734 [Caballeronia catudaia]|uniref:Uncharacterized protein n=1 Tax=Caballeronia catudaia TaxID=1777136 RepID=A0A158A4H8_9BURK|nr:hypothetical protein AWB75_01734 [Caballeronia catudaia]
MITSAESSASSAWRAAIVNPADVDSACGSAAQTRKSNDGTPIAPRSSPNTMHGTAR